MQFQIKCATFLRLASICNFFEPSLDAETRQKVNTLRLEISDDKVIAIATNVKTAAIEVVGSALPGSMGVAHVVIDPAILQQCAAESWFDGMLTISTVPEIAAATATTSSGWVYQGNACHWFDETPMDHWRNWAPDKRILETERIMYWNLFHLESLLKSSPSGKVIFPKYIDASIPIVLRDRENPNWVGLFIPSPEDHEMPIKKGAELPNWWNV